MKTYKETLDYLYTRVPMFQQVGSAGYKEGLDNTLLLDAHFGHPHRCYRTIHVAGTNGKGSCSHTLAAILQSAGYRVGLYTSPHLVDFRERIRVDGMPITQERVVEFVNAERAFFEPLRPSFFELTTALAFTWFAEQKVDVAVVEVGLGGRLDCTNIISPSLSIITNISFDHTQFLGDTLAKIASEKAGIIKPSTPVVIGETTPETRPVFLRKALDTGAPIRFAEEDGALLSASPLAEGGFLYVTADYGELRGELGGYCQEKNTRTLLTALRTVREAFPRVDERSVREGFARVCELTGLQGRWQRLGSQPAVVCDTGHNVGGTPLEAIGVQGSNAISVFGLNLCSTGLSVAAAEREMQLPVKAPAVTSPQPAGDWTTTVLSALTARVLATSFGEKTLPEAFLAEASDATKAALASEDEKLQSAMTLLAAEDSGSAAPALAARTGGGVFDLDSIRIQYRWNPNEWGTNSDF